MVEVQGQMYQHATVKPTALTGGPIFAFKTHKKVSYSIEVPKELTTDYQGQVDGFTIKPQKKEASISMKLSEYFAFRAALLASPSNAGLGVLQCQFDLPITYGNKINALKTDTLYTCMIQKEMRSSEDGQEALEVEVPLIFLTEKLADGPAMVYDP